jgi:hypothetical protein
MSEPEDHPLWPAFLIWWEGFGKEICQPPGDFWEAFQAGATVLRMSVDQAIREGKLLVVAHGQQIHSN